MESTETTRDSTGASNKRGCPGWTRSARRSGFGSGRTSSGDAMFNAGAVAVSNICALAVAAIGYVSGEIRVDAEFKPAPATPAAVLLVCIPGLTKLTGHLSVIYSFRDCKHCGGRQKDLPLNGLPCYGHRLKPPAALDILPVSLSNRKTVFCHEHSYNVLFLACFLTLSILAPCALSQTAPHSPASSRRARIGRNQHRGRLPEAGRRHDLPPRRLQNRDHRNPRQSRRDRLQPRHPLGRGPRPRSL